MLKKPDLIAMMEQQCDPGALEFIANALHVYTENFRAKR
jgi:hypothetical protein